MSFRPPVREALAELAGYHSPQLEVDVRLNTNESPEPPPPAFSKAVAERVEALEWNRYPDRGVTELRSKIAAHHNGQSGSNASVSGPPSGLQIDPANVFVANGSNEVLQTLMLAWGGPGRRVATFEPTYAMHGQIARVIGSEVVEIDRNDDFSLDLDSALATLTDRQPVITFVCSPNNPTGMVESRELIEALLETVRPFGLLVVDEAYAEFSQWSALALASESEPLIVTRTFSKTWAMAGARLGYAIAPTWVTEILSIAILPYHLDAVSQIAGVTALDFEEEMNARVARLVEQRGRIQAELLAMGVHVWPSQSNFVLFRPPSDSGQVWDRLVQAGVLVRNCSTWPRLEGCLRVTVGSAVENTAFLDALGAILAEPLS